MKRFLLIAVIALTASCSPRVATHLSSTMLTPLQSDAPVIVIGEQDKEPDNAYFLGTVEVTDTGFTTKCNYETVLSLAKNEVRKVGGNCLRIYSHRTPSFASTCHQISGSIYHIYDMSSMEEGPQLKPMQDEEAIIDSRTVIQREDPMSDRYTYSKFRLAVDVGYSYRTGKFEEEKYDVPRDYINKLRSGLTYSVSITPFINTYFGIGAKFAGNHYFYDQRGIYDKINTYYIGPEFIARLPTRSQRNAWIFSVSLGYVAYRENIFDGAEETRYKKSGFKTTTEIGYDIRISKNTYFGLKIGASSGAVPFTTNGEKYNVSLYAFEIGGGFRF